MSHSASAIGNIIMSTKGTEEVYVKPNLCWRAVPQNLFRTCDTSKPRDFR